MIRFATRPSIKSVAGTLMSISCLYALTACSTPTVIQDRDSKAASNKGTVQVEELSQGDQSADLDVEVDGPVQVNFRKITIPPGLGTGAHCHYGNLVAVVGQGTLTHYAPMHENGVHKYSAGDSIIEGPGYIHEGRNEGSEDVVLWVSYVTPQGKDLAETELRECQTLMPIRQ